MKTKSNYKTLFTIFLLITLLLVLPAWSFGASLGLNTGLPTLKSSAAFIDYLEFGPDGDLSTFGAEVDFVDGVSPMGFTELSFGVGFALADPTVGATGGFDIFDDNGLFLGGDLFAVGFVEDVIELQFDQLIGNGAGNFGSSVLVQVMFDAPLGTNPFASLVDGNFYSASVRVLNVVDISTVPEPAVFPLLLSALVGTGWLRRRRFVS